MTAAAYSCEVRSASPSCYKTRVGNEMIYLSLSELGSNYEAEEVEYMICAVAKPLVSEGLFATPHFLTLPLKQHLYYHVNSGDRSIQTSLEGSHSIDDLPGPSTHANQGRR